MIASSTSTPAAAQASLAGSASCAAADLAGAAAADPLAALFQTLIQTFSVVAVDSTTLAAPGPEKPELAELTDMASLLPTTPDFSPVTLLQHLDTSGRLQAAITPATGGGDAGPSPSLAGAAPGLVSPQPSGQTATATPEHLVAAADAAPYPTDPLPTQALNAPADAARTTKPLLAAPGTATPSKTPPRSPATTGAATAIAGMMLTDAAALEPEAVAPASPAAATPTRRVSTSESLQTVTMAGPLDMVVANESARPKLSMPPISAAATEQAQALQALETPGTAPVAGESGAAQALPPAATIESGATYRATIAAHPTAPSFPAELSSELRLLVKGGIQHAELSLNPLELGPIRIELSLSLQTADITFTAANAITREGIAQSLTQLRDMLGSQGIDLGQTHVGAEAQGQKQTAQEGQQAKAPFPSTQAGHSPNTAIRGQIVNPASRRNGLLDLYA